MNLEPKAEAFLAALAAANLPPFDAGTPEQARRSLRALRPAGAPRPLPSVTDHYTPCEDHAVPIRLYRPAEDVPGCILYLHGGGWVMGETEGFDAFARELAFMTGWAVALVEYRLAPEHPFPAALDDADAALRWLGREAGTRFGPAAAIVVMGDSAGGNLAAVLTLRERERQGVSISAQVLVYPITDAGMDTDSFRLFADGPILTAPLMAWFWSHYVSDEGQRRNPDCSPLRAISLADLPPTFVLTAENDPLRDEGEAFAAALAGAGVPVRCRRYEGQVHGFATMVGLFDGGAEALRDIAAFLNDISSSGYRNL